MSTTADNAKLSSATALERRIIVVNVYQQALRLFQAVCARTFDTYGRMTRGCRDVSECLEPLGIQGCDSSNNCTTCFTLNCTGEKARTKHQCRSYFNHKKDTHPHSALVTLTPSHQVVAALATPTDAIRLPLLFVAYVLPSTTFNDSLHTQASTSLVSGPLVGLRNPCTFKSRAVERLRVSSTFSSDSSSSFFLTDPCDPNPCSNGSTCQADGASYTCQCAEGLYGKNCQYGKSNISKLISTPTCFHFLLLTLYLASPPYERFEREVYFYGENLLFLQSNVAMALPVFAGHVKVHIQKQTVRQWARWKSATTTR